MPDIDFEGLQQNNDTKNSPADTNPNNNPANKADTTNLNGNDIVDINSNENNNNNDSKPVDNNNDTSNNDNKIPHDIEVGTEVEVDGAIYKIDDKGNLVTDKGEVFKEAKDVKQWLIDNGYVDNNDDSIISINSIIDAIGIDVVDEFGKPIEFTNDAAGIKSYIDAVVNLKSNEIQQGAINKLYSDNPLLKEFIDYVKLTGTPRGFGDIPDRSGIILDKENEAQLEAVIKMAANEFGNKSLNDNYIKYLKSTGSLYDEAKVQLDALIDKDKKVREDIKKRADAARAEELENERQYFERVDKAIKDRRIGGYLLPQTIIKEVNGQKITYKLDDFYAYVSKPTEVDANGNRMTGYTRDLNKLSDKEILDRDLLDAWLMWTGGSYKDLVDMAIKEDSVRRLVAKSKETRTQRHIKVNKPSKSNDKSQLIFE